MHCKYLTVGDVALGDKYRIGVVIVVYVKKDKETPKALAACIAHLHKRETPLQKSLVRNNKYIMN